MRTANSANAVQEPEVTPVIPAEPVAAVPDPVVPDPAATPSEPAAPPATPEPVELSEDETLDVNPMVPRGRINAEKTKRKAAEEKARKVEAELEALKATHAAPPASPVLPPDPANPPKDAVTLHAEQMSAEAGMDEYGNPNLSVAAARVVVLNQLQINHASGANARLDANVAKFVKENPSYAPYVEKIKTELSPMAVGIKDNPANVIKIARELRGADTDRLVAEAEERGKTKALEQKKIVSQGKGEIPSALPAGKSAGDMLTAAEKATADRNNMSYEDYHASKGKRSI